MRPALFISANQTKVSTNFLKISLLRESFTLDEIGDAGTVSGMTCIRVLLFKSYKWIR